MYSLLMSGIQSLWDRSPAEFSLDRIFEHTSQPLRERFSNLDGSDAGEIPRLPALFAYESPLRAEARVGRVTRVQRRSGGFVRVGFEVTAGIPPIGQDKLLAMAWELDITDSEFNRTHWAVKDVDLMQELARAGLLGQGDVAADRSSIASVEGHRELVVRPSVFKVPSGDIEADLVSVMRPFNPGFECVSEAIGDACARLGLRCQDANTEWRESEIIQDIFSLLFRSRVVVCDFSGLEPERAL